MKIVQLLLLSMLFISPLTFVEEPQEIPKIEEKSSLSSGIITINETSIEYQTEAATLLLKDEEEKPKASFFYVAYTKKEADREKRPVTFCFNGGPGSSAVWVHLGFLGPKKIATTDEGVPQYPARLEENPYSLLDLTDLVFIDPVSTGYSRPAPGEDPKQFHGVEEDIESVAEFIRLYTTRNDRWASPKFVLGESYGTTRAAGLAEHLHKTHQMDLDGLILISTALNFQTLRWERGNDLPYLLFLPSFTATAWSHGKLPSDLQSRPLEEILPEVEQFVQDDYSQALFKGASLTPEEKARTIQKLSYYTGLSEDYIDQANLRIHIYCFVKELLRSEKRTVGRFDSRFKGIDYNAIGEVFDYDPSAELIFGSFTSLFNHYLKTELKWDEDREYQIIANVWPWNFGKVQNQYLNMAEPLREVMTKNPMLKVFVASGTFDLATPYLATQYTFDHLGLDPTLQHHIIQKRYSAGHMMYLHQPSLKALKQDLIPFYQIQEKPLHLH